MINDEIKNKCNKKFIFVIILSLCFCIYFIISTKYTTSYDFFKSDDEANSIKENKRHKINATLTKLLNPKQGNEVLQTLSFLSNSNTSQLHFDINSTDVMVFLHIQKTGGTTFGRHLVQDLKSANCVERIPHRKRVNRYKCSRPNGKGEWLFSRFSTGWPCGVHADWTSLTECVPTVVDRKNNVKKRFFYITVLREPVSRFLSEFLHVSRGATWSKAHLLCNGVTANYPFCWKEDNNWRDVTLDEFMDCDENLAHNRQTRMLADMRAVDCRWLDLNDQEKGMLLKTAKQNLKDMVFFGLTEQQEETQLLFESTFKLYFKEKFSVFNTTRADRFDYSEEQINRIKQLNSLDIELYEYASELFRDRLKELRSGT